MEPLHPAVKNFCLWHRDCTKQQWCREFLTQHVLDPSSVDGPEPYDFDDTLIPPRRKCPDPFHVNKNALPSLIEQLYKIHGGNVPEFSSWLRGIKWGMADSAQIHVHLSPCMRCPPECTAGFAHLLHGFHGFFWRRLGCTRRQQE